MVSPPAPGTRFWLGLEKPQRPLTGREALALQGVSVAGTEKSLKDIRDSQLCEFAATCSSGPVITALVVVCLALLPWQQNISNDASREAFRSFLAK